MLGLLPSNGSIYFNLVGCFVALELKMVSSTVYRILFFLVRSYDVYRSAAVTFERNHDLICLRAFATKRAAGNTTLA